MPRRSIFGEVKDTNKRGQCQIYSNIAEREYLRQAKDTKSRKQCKLICFLPRRNILGAAKVRFPFVSPRPAEDVPDAAGGAMPPSAWAAAGFRSSAAAEERIFRNCILAGLRPAGSHCEKSGKIPTLHCIPSGTTNPVILRRKSKPIPTQASPPASPRKQRRKRPCPIGFRHICPKTEK